MRGAHGFFLTGIVDMSITIHHGSNGSYKTSGVIQDYFIPAAKQGRVVVTNIRGVTRENTMMYMDDVPDSFDVITVDTDTSDGRYKIAHWWHWVPLGALLLFDEAGVMFPKAWRPTDLQKLDFPGGVDAAQEEGRPFNWTEAWEMHRHYNWDIVLTCPNIKSVRDDIRQTTEGAYKHKNKALLGPIFKGYKEGYHDAQKNGQSATDFDTIGDKRITDLTFKLYASTRTGAFKGSLNGFNLFLSPRILLPMAVAVLSLGYSISSGVFSVLSTPKPEVVEESVPGDQLAVPEGGSVPVENSSVGLYENLAQSFDSAGSDVASVDDVEVSSVTPAYGQLLTGPLSGRSVHISASLKASNRFYYAFKVSGSSRVLSLSDVSEMGYSVDVISKCSVVISYQGLDSDIGCFDQFEGESVTAGAATNGAANNVKISL